MPCVTASGLCRGSQSKGRVGRGLPAQVASPRARNWWASPASLRHGPGISESLSRTGLPGRARLQHALPPGVRRLSIKERGVAWRERERERERAGSGRVRVEIPLMNGIRGNEVDNRPRPDIGDKHLMSLDTQPLIQWSQDQGRESLSLLQSDTVWENWVAFVWQIKCWHFLATFVVKRKAVWCTSPSLVEPITQTHTPPHLSEGRSQPQIGPGTNYGLSKLIRTFSASAVTMSAVAFDRFGGACNENEQISALCFAPGWRAESVACLEKIPKLQQAHLGSQSRLSTQQLFDKLCILTG